MEVGNNVLDVGADDDIPHDFDPELVSTGNISKSSVPAAPVMVKVTDNPSETNISVDSVDMATLATSGVTLERIASNLKTLSEVTCIKEGVSAKSLVGQSDVFDLKTALEDYPTPAQSINPKVFTAVPSSVNSTYFLRTVNDVDAQLRDDVIQMFSSYTSESLADTSKVIYKLRDVYLKRILDMSNSCGNELREFIANYDHEKDCKYFSGPEGLVDISSLDICGDWSFSALHSSCDEFDPSVLPECDVFKSNIKALLENSRFKAVLSTLPEMGDSTMSKLLLSASVVEIETVFTARDIANVLRDNCLSTFLETSMSILTGTLDEIVKELQEKTNASTDDPELLITLDYELIKDYSVRLKDLVELSSKTVTILNTSAVFLANAYGLFSRFNQF
jgi:hypothetical protein